MNQLAGNEKFVSLFAGWTPKTLTEKKLVLGIIHKKNHKDVVEERVLPSSLRSSILP